jgi:hypothetical protein
MLRVSGLKRMHLAKAATYRIRLSWPPTSHTMPRLVLGAKSACYHTVVGRGRLAAHQDLMRGPAREATTLRGKFAPSEEGHNKSRLVFEAPSVSEAHLFSSLSESESPVVIPLLRPAVEARNSLRTDGRNSQRRLAPRGASRPRDAKLFGVPLFFRSGKHCRSTSHSSRKLEDPH